MFEGRDAVGLGLHALLHVPVDPPGHVSRGGDRPALVHEVAGIAVTAAEGIPAFFVGLVDIEDHLGGELVQFFFCRKL